MIGEQRIRRRDVIKAAAATVPAALLGSRPSDTLAAPGFRGKNIVLFITDQQRATQHFPRGWEAKHLPGLTRLKRNGLSFDQAFTSTCMCSPSRASLLTGLFPAQHGVTSTLALGPNGVGQTVLPTNLPNLASVMSAAGYSVVYKGKWHLSKPSGDPDTENWAPEDLGKYGFQRWDPPDAGENQDIDQFGGGTADNDARFVNGGDGQEGAIEYLKTVTPGDKPFCLIVSLVNPHDVLAYPRYWRQGGYRGTKWLRGNIQLPPNERDNLRTKPTVQREVLALLNVGIGRLRSKRQRLNYVNFYGNVIKEADRHLVNLLKTLDATGLTNNTVVIATSDHGEMGLSHGGLRQKMYNVYEETIRVPLVISNPKLFPRARTTRALASHVDFLPTMASLFGAPPSARSNWKGVDNSAVIRNPKAKGKQNYVAFTFDDHPDTLKGFTRIVSIRERRYKIAKYWNTNRPRGPYQWEMYDLRKDPNELTNLTHRTYKASRNELSQIRRMKTKLRRIERTRLQPR